MVADPVIRFESVGLTLGTTQVHRALDFSIEKGETVTLMGPSGTGKTLILKMMMGLLRPTAGAVTVLGHRVSEVPERELRVIRMRIGMLFQGAALFDSLSVFENVAYGLREFGERGEGGMAEERIREIVAHRLELVGLGGFENRTPPSLSGGQRKRVGLARALATSPEVMLFDEPTTGLDPSATKRIDDLISQLRREYLMTSIVVTHDMASARRVSSRWILIDQGRILADGPVARLAMEDGPVNRFVEGRWEGE